MLGLKSLAFAPAMSHHPRRPRRPCHVSCLGDDLLGFVRGERHGNLRRLLLYSYECLVSPKKIQLKVISHFGSLGGILFFYFWGVLYLYEMTYGIHTSTDHYLRAVSGWFHWHLILQLAAPFQIHFGPQNRHETRKLQEIHWASISQYKGPPGFYNVLPSKFWWFP